MRKNLLIYYIILNKKNDLFLASNVVFLKAHIKISYLAKFSEFWSFFESQWFE